MSPSAACSACTQRAQRRWCGAYQMRCVVCCAALVISARPHRPAQQALLACITRRPENPKQAEVLAAIQQADAAHATALAQATAARATTTAQDLARARAARR